MIDMEVEVVDDGLALRVFDPVVPRHQVVAHLPGHTACGAIPRQRTISYTGIHVVVCR